MSQKPPQIASIDASRSRPFWSVMIPTYNAPAGYLEETLRSVLQQDPGPEQMQIEVVDDCSPNGAAVELIRRIAGDRITIHCEPKNLGLANIWNRCIERARGEWVHILHQDDLVYPGFYAVLRRGVETQVGVGAAFTRFAFMNPAGHWLAISELHQQTGGVLANWHETITGDQLIQCPAIVVRRSVYEQLGGFLPELKYALDWEMWQRIASQHAFWFDPGILAAYRTHPESATSRLQLDASDIRDIRDVINLTAGYHPSQRAARLIQKPREHYAKWAITHARKLLVDGHPEAARKQIVEALKLSCSWPVLCEIWSFLWLRFRLFGATIKRQLRRGKSRGETPGQ